eukprot:12666264-Heterocapsa_arctica.AAC.1
MPRINLCLNVSPPAVLRDSVRKVRRSLSESVERMQTVHGGIRDSVEALRQMKGRVRRTAGFFEPPEVAPDPVPVFVSGALPKVAPAVGPWTQHFDLSRYDDDDGEK